MTSEVSAKADFSFIRYAQCWEDADILLEALRIQPHHVCLAIASAGDNVLAMASQGPQRVIALDLNPAQLACLALRVAAYRVLDYPEMLAFIGARPSGQRLDFYERCRPQLTLAEQRFWDANAAGLAQGFGNIGKFERYLRLFGTRLLPLLETPQARRALLKPHTVAQRRAFYAQTWNNWRWRTLFSRRVMGWLGRDPEFFTYVETNVAAHMLARTAYALTTLDPTENPYLQWILLGQHGAALPYALRAEQFAAIRANLDRIEWRNQALEDFLQGCAPHTIDGYNLSDIFEYMSLANYHALLAQLVQVGRKGGRLVYWNMLAPRRRPAALAQQLCPLDALAQQLYARDKAFFYSAFVVEEIM